MSDPERADSSSVRSTNVIHLMPTSWDEVAVRCAPLVARVDAENQAVQVVVVVPSASDAAELARDLSVGVRAAGFPAAALGNERRARRLLTEAKPTVIVSTIAVLQALVTASAVKLDQVSGILIAGADEMEPQAALVEQILSECPKEAARIVTTPAMTPFVERLATSHMHGARRVSAPPAASPPDLNIEVVPTSGASPITLLGDVLETIDAPSVAIIPTNPRHTVAVTEALAALGYAAGSPLARLCPDGDTGGASLVIFVGAPRAQQLAMVLAAPPGRVVALMSTRERTAFIAAVPGARITAYAPVNARAAAVAADEALRDRIRRNILDSAPGREMFALEPLLAEFDPFVIAGALLRLFEREQNSARRAAESRAVAPVEAPRSKPAADDRPARSDDRPARSFDRPARSDDRPPRSGERKSFGDRKPSFGERKSSGDRKPSFGDRKPRSGGSKPGFGDRKPSFGDRKPSFGDRKPRFDDRSDRGERGSRPPRSSDRPSSGRRSDRPPPRRGDR